MTGSAVQNNTVSGGSRSLEACLRNPLKILSQLVPFVFFTFLIKGIFREIRTWEIVICSLLSHHILTPNELICLTPAAIRQSFACWSLDLPIVYLAVKWPLNLHLSQLILSVNYKMLYGKNKCWKFYDFAGDFHVKAGEPIKQWKSR